MIVDWAVYCEGRRRADIDDLNEAVAAGADDAKAFVWLGMHEPTDAEFGSVREAFDLHPLAVEDAVHAHQRPKLERYGDSLFVVLKTARYLDDDEEVDIGEIMCFVGEGFIITVRHGDTSALSDVRRELEANPGRLALGPGAVLHAVADRVVDDYEVVLAGLDIDVGEVEDEVFSPGRHNHAERIYRLKRETQSFRRATRPLGPPLELLASRPPIHVDDELREYFRDVHDHLIRASDRLSDIEELLTSALNANQAQIGIRQNEDMRRISAWVAIAAVPTMIAGIYGMNFEYMPALSWTYGYPLVLTIMAVICVTLYRVFKRSGWL